MTRAKDTSYQQYISRIQATWQTPPEVINRFVEETVGSKPTHYTRIMAGEANEVYAVRLLNEHEIIVRISRDGEKLFTKEQWAMAQCEKNGIPVPKFYGIQNVTVNGEEIELCSMEKLAGSALRQLYNEKKISHEKMRDVFQNVGMLLRRIHSIKTKRFGNINGKGEGKAPTFSQWMLERTKQPENHIRRGKRHAIKDQSIVLFIDILKKHRKTYDTITPHLVHGDMGYDHIMVDGDEITGIIDWGGAKSVDPAYDFALVHFFHEKKEAYRSLLFGYQAKKPLDGNFEHRIHLCKLLLILDQLDYYDMTGFERGIDIVKRNIREELEYFKNESS